MNKLVSVIIPAYNVEKYIKEAVRSVLGQSYTNLEVIAIDDGSTDKTLSVLQNLAKDDNRLRVFSNSENKQIVYTLNKALRLSYGQYIVRMDGDDISMPDRVEKLINFLEENHEYSLVGSSMTAIDPDGRIIGKTIHYSNEELLIRCLKYVTPVSHIWAARKEVYEKLNGYRDIPGVEDYDFLLRMTASGLRYTNIQDYYGYYVRLGRAGNTIQTLGIRQLLLKKYVYTLYLSCKKKKKKTFSISKVRKIQKYDNSFMIFLHDFSSSSLNKAIVNKGKKNYLKMLYYVLLSLCSPYQVSYLLGRIFYRIILLWKKK